MRYLNDPQTIKNLWKVGCFSVFISSLGVLGGHDLVLGQKRLGIAYLALLVLGAFDPKVPTG